MKRLIRNGILVLLALTASCTLDDFCADKEDTIDDDAPPPTYVYPPNHSTGQSRTPLLVWNAYPHAPTGVHHYELHLKSGFSDDDKILDDFPVYYDTFHAVTDTLDADTEYWWDVYVYDQYDDVSIGTKWYFTTGSGFNNPPVPPFDPDPADGSSSNALYADLHWDCYDPDGDDLSYDVWLNTIYTDSARIAAGVTGQTVDPGDLEPDRIYYWKVLAIDAPGDTTEGPWWRFKTRTASNKPPVEPFGPYPPDEATSVGLDVTLAWSCSDPEDDPVTYDVVMGPAGGSLVVVADDITESSFEVAGLDRLSEYEGNVLASDDHSHTTAGPLWSFTTGDGSSVVYASLVFGRSITYDGSVARNDYIFARFDSLYAPDGPINPLQPAAVSCNTFDLVWSDGLRQYSYTDYIAGYFLDPGTPYTYTVTAGDGVPALSTNPVTMPACQPYITSPAPFSTVSRNGFDLEWHTFCGGTIDITIMDLNADSTGVYITTENDGFYSFTAEDLSPIDPMAYQLQIVLIHENRQTITAPGYDPRSRVWARVLSTQIVYTEF